MSAYDEAIRAKIKDRIVEFCYWKAKMLKRPDYFTKEDEADIRSWDWEKLVMVVEEIELRNDSSICPYCIVFSDDCEECGYGAKHGVCGEDFVNTYSNVTKYEHINDQIGLEEIKAMIDHLFGDLKEAV